jgi:hypothetical protein
MKLYNVISNIDLFNDFVLIFFRYTMKIFYKYKFNKLVSLQVLIFYTFLWSVNIFHHHQVELLVECNLSDHNKTNAVQHSYSYDQNFTCTIHSNYVSLTSLKFDSFIFVLTHQSNELERIFLYDEKRITETLFTQNNLRAPPLS